MSLTSASSVLDTAKRLAIYLAVFVIGLVLVLSIGMYANLGEGTMLVLLFVFALAVSRFGKSLGLS